jgi:hypothetical protein
MNAPTEEFDPIDWPEIGYTIPMAWSDGGSEKMNDVTQDWLLRLKNLEQSMNPSDNQKESIKQFTEFLLDHQISENPENMRMIGGWCLDIDPRMPSDARVDFIYFPTYIAVSWLVLLKEKYPEISKDIQSYDVKLKVGLDFSAGRNFVGHGYEGYEQMLEAMAIFNLGGVFDFIIDRPTFSPKFRHAIEKASVGLNRHLRKQEEAKANDDVFWGGVDYDKGMQALDVLIDTTKRSNENFG